ncbi:MAG: hypothetical protein U1A78_36005 [Polyangia bacterium]
MVRKLDSRRHTPRRGTTRTEATLEQPFLQLPVGSVSDWARREPRAETSPERSLRPGGSHVIELDLVGDDAD